MFSHSHAGASGKLILWSDIGQIHPTLLKYPEQTILAGRGEDIFSFEADSWLRANSFLITTNFWPPQAPGNTTSFGHQFLSCSNSSWVIHSCSRRLTGYFAAITSRTLRWKYCTWQNRSPFTSPTPWARTLPHIPTIVPGLYWNRSPMPGTSNRPSV